MEDVPETVATLNTLTEMGIHLSIDDFRDRLLVPQLSETVPLLLPEDRPRVR